MTRNQPHDGPWFQGNGKPMIDGNGNAPQDYYAAKSFANANGIRAISNGKVSYFRGADSFWYQGGKA